MSNNNKPKDQYSSELRNALAKLKWAAYGGAEPLRIAELERKVDATIERRGLPKPQKPSQARPKRKRDTARGGMPWPPPKH